MNKTELTAVVAEKAEISKKDAAAAVSAMVEAITAELVAGGKVQLVGFGTFEVKDVAARTARNPSTGAEIQLPATRKPAFKAGAALKEAVAK